MNAPIKRTVTVIYYEDGSLELMHDIQTFEKNPTGRVIIPKAYKSNKSIIAVCDGEIQILNKVGERILSLDFIAK